MDLQLSLRYATRHWVQFGPLTRTKTAALAARERIEPAQRQASIDAALRRTLMAASQQIPAHASLRGHLPQTELVEFLRHSVPITTKEMLQSQRADYYPNGGQQRPWSIVGRTSGTTGSPLEVFRNLESLLWEHAVLLQHWAWAGVRPGDRQVVARGDYVVPLSRNQPPYWFQDHVGANLFISTRHINRSSAPDISGSLKRFGARFMRAYPSAAYELAKLVLELRLPIRFASVITSSETLYQFQREAIEQAFQAKVFSGYGMSERVIYAAECEHGRMHVNPEYGVVEIVDDAGRATDAEGLLVGTSLHNTLMPLLRYQLKDSARWDHRPCPCGRTYPVIQDLVGKVEDRLFDLDGNPISPSVMTFAFKDAGCIQRAQVAQTASDQWVIRVVPDSGYSDAVSARLVENFRSRVSSRVNLQVQLVDAIATLPTGKFKWVSQEWKRN